MIVSSASSLSSLFPVSNAVRVQSALRTGAEASSIPDAPAVSSTNLDALAGEEGDADEKIYTRSWASGYTADELKAKIDVIIRAAEALMAHHASMPDQTKGQEVQLEALARGSALSRFPELKSDLELGVASYNHTLKYLRLETNPEKAASLERFLQHNKAEIDRTIVNMRGAYDLGGDLVRKQDDGTYVVGSYTASYKGTTLR